MTIAIDPQPSNHRVKSHRDIRSPQQTRLQYVESHNDDITEVSPETPVQRNRPIHQGLNEKHTQKTQKLI